MLITVTFLLTVSLFIVNDAYAQIIVASNDSYVSNGIDGELADTNFGDTEQLIVGTQSDREESRVFIKFDLSDISPGNLKRATLRLYHVSTTGNADQYLGIHKVETKWHELYTDNSNSGLTWSTQPKINQGPLVIFQPGQQGQAWTEIEITPLAVEWLSGQPNFGIAIVKEYNLTDSGTCIYEFSSKESDHKYRRPILKLIIERESNSIVGK